MTESTSNQFQNIHDDYFYFEIYDHLKIKDEIEDNDYFKTSANHTISFLFRIPTFEQEKGRKAFLELELCAEIPHNSTKAKPEAFSLNLNDLDLPDDQADSLYATGENKSHILVTEKCPITKYNFYEFINAMTKKHIDNYLNEIKYPPKEKKEIINYFSVARFEAVNSLIKLTFPNLKCDNSIDEIKDMAELIGKTEKKKNFLNLQSTLKIKTKTSTGKKI